MRYLTYLAIAVFASLIRSTDAARSYKGERIMRIAEDVFPRPEYCNGRLWHRPYMSIMPHTAHVEEVALACLLEGRHEDVDDLIELGVTNYPRWADAQGNTLLYWAVKQRHHRLADALIRAGADVLFESPTAKMTLLHVAIINQDDTMVLRLLQGDMRQEYSMHVLMRFAQENYRGHMIPLFSQREPVATRPSARRARHIHWRHDY